MQAVYKYCDCRRLSGPSLLRGSNVSSTIRPMSTEPTTRDTQMPLYHASVEMLFIADAGAKILKNAIFLLVMMPCGGWGATDS